MGAFIGSLRADLVMEVRVYRSKTYLDTVEVACLRDDHLNAVKRGTRTEVHRGETNPPNQRATGNSATGTTKVASRPNPQGLDVCLRTRCKRGVKKDFVLIAMRGSCPEHKCKTAQAFLIELVKSENEDGDYPKEETEMNSSKISVHAITGMHGPRKMKLDAWVKDRGVMSP